MPHIIGKQIIELNLSNAKNAFHLQHTISQLYWQRIIKELEVIFDQIAPGKEVIQINQLEIDLGDLSSEQLLQGTFIKDLKIKIETALTDLETNKPQQIKKQSAAQTVFSQWIYFLQNGFFENHQSIPSKDWENQILRSIENTSARLSIAQKNIAANPAVLTRLIGHHSTQFLQQLIALFTDLPQHELSSFIEEWQQLLIKGKELEKDKGAMPSGKVIRHQFWKFAVTTCFVKSEKRSTDWLIGAYLQQNIETPLFKTICQIVEKEKQVYPVFQKLVQQKEFWESNHNDELTTHIEEPSTPQKEVAQNTWHIPHAGVILLHPFLVHFFKKLELLEKNTFKSEETQHKAILLMDYLATKTVNIPEYNLVLAKLLCGLPLNTPINYLVQLNTEEKAEAEKLLQAAIDHWGALKKASPDGLREGFLKRTGLLKKLPTGWKLQIEQQTMDLLLDRLPWGLGIVKLLFMEEMLRVEWR